MAENPTNEDLAYFIYNCPILDSNYEIVDKIKEKWKINVVYSQVQRFRKNLPKMQKRRLEKSRKELLAIYLFIINQLKSEIEKFNASSDTEIRLKFFRELRDFMRLYNILLKEEVECLDRRAF